MKAVFATLSFLVTIALGFLPAHAAPRAASNAALSILAFTSCEDAITRNLKHTTLPIRQDYDVKLFVTTNARAPKTTNVVVWIEDGPGDKPENPRITAVCVDQKLNLPTQEKGEIKFQSKPGDTIKIRFHLEKLQISKWKKDTTSGLANDSIMVKEYSSGSSRPPPPPLNLTDWPRCLPTKTVHLDDDPISHRKETEIFFDFSPCANPSQTVTLNYVYQLVLLQYPAGGGTPTPYPIDPIIINKP